MTSRLSRRLLAFLCVGLLALTVLVGTVVMSSSGVASLALYPPGPSIALNPQPDPPGAIAGVIVNDGIIMPNGVIIQG